MNVSAYVNALNQGITAASSTGLATVTGLAGRIIRGKKPADFESFTDDPERKIVMFVGPDGLAKFLGKTGYEMLVTVGYEPDYLVHKVQEGNQFKLVVLPEGKAARLATWDNSLDLVGEVYPDIAAVIERHRTALKNTPLAEIEKTAGFKFLDVEKAGKTDPRFMTLERLKASSGTLADVRAFLYFSVHLRELYRGDGYTDENGKQGPMEYIVPNMRIADCGEHAVIDIEVILPSAGRKGTTTMNATATNRNTMPLPGFFDAKSAGQVWPLDYMGLFAEALAWRERYNVRNAAKDAAKIALLGIDNQITFCMAPPWGQLPVAGAVEDSARFAEFIYRNLDVITKVILTLDTHTAWQIFHPTFLVNTVTKQHPTPGTLIANDDVQKGVWQVTPEAAFAILGDANKLNALQGHLRYYSQKLSDGGKYPLIVWPFHSMLGSTGHAVVPIIEQAAFFHSIVRGNAVGLETKGGHPLTEAYSPFEEEVTTTANGAPIGQTNPKILETLIAFDAVIIGGQAKSHCVRSAIANILKKIKAQDPQLAKKIYLVEDLTSPVIIPGVVDFTKEANQAFAEFAAEGMNVVQSTTPLEQWPGMDAILN